MMTWKVSDAEASTFAVAKPTPELAPVCLCQQTNDSTRIPAMHTSYENDCGRHGVKSLYPRGLRSAMAR